MDQLLFWLVPAASVLALCFAWYFHHEMMKESEGTPQMIKIAAAVRKGAMSYLRQQYKIVGWVFLGLVILFSVMAYGFGVQKLLGADCFPYRRILLRTLRLSGHEDGYIRFGAYCQCSPQFAECRIASGFPQRCGDGTGRGWPWSA